MKDKIISIFGGTGFVGKYVVNILAKEGARIKIITRYPNRAHSLYPSMSPGQIACTYGDISKLETIDPAITGADIVINLVGILYENKKQHFDSIHARGAEIIAKSATKHGIERLIHVSALGIDQPGSSHYSRSKLTGEKAVLEAFNRATILRPSVIFGPEDNFINRFSTLVRYFPILPLAFGGATKFQPVYVEDVAKAALHVLQQESSCGKIYEIGGPEILTLTEIIRMIAKELHRHPIILPLPYRMAMAQALLLEQFPAPLLTRDQVRLLQQDNIINHQAIGLLELGITPTPLSAIIPKYVKI